MKLTSGWNRHMFLFLHFCSIILGLKLTSDRISNSIQNRIGWTGCFFFRISRGSFDHFSRFCRWWTKNEFKTDSIPFWGANRTSRMEQFDPAGSNFLGA